MIPKIFYKPALFLDRDGVINKDFGHVHTIKKLSYNKKIFSIIRYFQKKNYFIFIVTNQSGIAKGFYNLKKFIEFQKYIKKDLFKKNIYINDIEFCPHHPEAIIKAYKIICNCRKPKNGMIKNLKKKWHIDLNKSLFIGDNKTDYICAKSLHIKFKYFKK
jgi:D-glycero-D-manno-heptose 1,7-bisphosphate phosphatase